MSSVPARHAVPGTPRRRLPRRTRLGLLLLGIVAACSGLAATFAALAAATPSSDLAWTWSMPNRFGLDANRDGLVDYRTDTGFLSPTGYQVDVDACASPAIRDRGATTKVTWTAIADGVTKRVTGTCRAAFSALQRDVAYTVTASLTDEATVRARATVTPRDLFIVSIGDSVASGEGSPDRVTRKPDNVLPTYQPTWQDARCDRSALAGPAQAALRLEDRDPHSSITFVHLACSGATIAKGLLGPYEGQHPVTGSPDIAPQLDQVAALTAVRSISTLTVSIGANDMGFGDIVKSCLYETSCQNGRGKVAYDNGLPTLPGLYGQLEQRVAEVGSGGRIGRVVQTEYFDVSTGDGSTPTATKYCTGASAQEQAGDTAPGDTAPVDGFTPDEYAWAHEVVGVNLNRAVAAHVTHANTAFPNGPRWHLVDGIGAAFNGHGYCGTDRWIRQMFESLSYQGGIDGAFHPNAEGHLYGYAAGIERVIAGLGGFEGTIPVPFATDPRVQLANDGISEFLGTLDSTNAFDSAADRLPFGARDGFRELWNALFKGIHDLKAGIPLAAGPTTTWTAWDNRVDDLDGDGDPTSDVHGIPGVTVDLRVDSTPRLVTDRYDVDVSLVVTAAGDTPFRWAIDSLQLTGGGVHAAGTASMTLGTTMRLTADPLALFKPVQFKAGPVATIGLDLAADFGSGDALRFASGLVGATATGSVRADLQRVLTLDPAQDTDHDGWVQLSELAATPLTARCASHGVQAHLDVTASLAGLAGRLGTIDLQDPSLCDGLSAPQVRLADLDGFRNVTLGDVLTGIAQVARSLQAAQTAGDVELPFLGRSLASVADVSERLTEFFVDNGLTSADQPLARIDVDRAGAAGITDLQTLAPKLSCALFADDAASCTEAQRIALGMRYDPATQRVTFVVSTTRTPKPVTAEVDLTETLEAVGVTALSGTGAARISPTYTLSLGFGFSLAPGIDLQDRFFLTAGPEGRLISLDAPVTADLELTGGIALADVTLSDGVTGPVALLQRRNAAAPMVAVTAVDPNRDGILTLAELSRPAAGGTLPFTATFNLAVPPTALRAGVSVLGSKLADGAITLAWPTVPDPSGLQITTDAAFTTAALPFAYDSENPSALIGQIVGAVRTGLTSVRSAIARGGAATTRPLPLLGRSVADLDPVLARVQTSLDALITTTDRLTLAQLQTRVNSVLVQALGASADATLVTFTADVTGGRAAIVVRMTLGACTADRTAAEGCSTVVPGLDLPIALPLGASALGGLAGATTDGGVVVGFDARATLTVGVLLPKVLAGVAGGAPRVDSGTPRPTVFVQDDSRVELGIGAQVKASLRASLGPVRVAVGTKSDPATAQLAARFILADPQAVVASPQRYVVGSSEFDRFLSRLVPAGPPDLQETRSGLGTRCAPTAPATTTPQACASLPLAVLGADGEPAARLGTVTVSLPRLLDPSGWTVDTAAVEAALSGQALQFALLVQGVDALAGEVQQGLADLPAGTRIPFLGADLTAGADVVKSFRDAVLGPLRDAANAMQGPSTVDGIRAAAQPHLDRIGILATSGGVAVKPTLAFTCGTASSTSTCAGTSPATEVRRVEVTLKVFVGFERSTSFDLGFPGLALRSGGAVAVKGGLRLDLTFGLDRGFGFYLPVAQNTMELGVGVTLPNNPNGPDLTGDIAFVPVELENGWRDNADNRGRPDASANVRIGLTTSRADGRVGLLDLASLTTTPVVSAESHIDLRLRTVRPENASSAVPSVSTTVRSEAAVTWSPGSAPRTSASLAFNDVTVDAGSLVEDFVGPVLEEIHGFTQPLERPIAALRQTIPGTDIVGDGKTWLELMRAVAGNGTAIQVVDRVIQLTDLVATLSDQTAAPGQIRIGSFVVAGDAVRAPVPPSAAGSVITSSSTTSNPLAQLAFADDPLGEKAAALRAQTTRGGFDIPILSKPTSLFRYLLGQDVPLATFDAGTLSVSPSLQMNFPVGPVMLYVGGMFKVSGHFAAGFDTRGIRAALHGGGDTQAVNRGLLQGFYLDDNDAAGNDVPEISLRAEFTVGASLGVPGFAVGIEGGIGAQFDFNLYTEPEWEGKVRIENIVDQLERNPNPMCFFDLGAKIDIFLRARAVLPVGDLTLDIAEATIWKQRSLNASCHGGEGPGRPATFSKGVVTLAATDQFDDVVVTLGQPDQWGRPVTIDNGFDEPVTFRGVTKVRGDLGGGDDSFQIVREDGGTGGGFAVAVCGGAGSDVLDASVVGPATLRGDGGEGCADVTAGTEGDDRLTGSELKDVLEGGPGDDTMIGNTAQDRLDGGAGDDVLRGGRDNDVMDGGAGDDVLVGGTGNDTLTGGADADTVDYSDHTDAVTVTLPGRGGSGAEADTLVGFEHVVGGPGSDTLRVGTGLPTLVSGGSGSDTVLTGASEAVVFGGPGNDIGAEEPGAQTFWGGDGTDTFSYAALTVGVTVTVDGVAGDGPTGSGADNIAETEIVAGGNGSDHLVAGSRNVRFEGNGGADLLEGGAGDDTLSGGPGADTVRGGEGINAVIGGDDDDVLVGGTERDTFDGGSGRDTADYSARTERVDISLDGIANDGRPEFECCASREKDNVLTTIEVVIGGSGPDQLYGSTGSDELHGGPGEDGVRGGPAGVMADGGADILDGGEGPDLVCDIAFCLVGVTADASVDTLVGGNGVDRVYSGGGHDTLDGGEGGDTLLGSSGDDTVRGGAGGDTVLTYGGRDVVDGGPGADDIDAGRGDDTVAGGGNAEKGTEWLIGGQGADTLTTSEEGSIVWSGTGDTHPHGSGGRDPQDGIGDTVIGGPGDDTLEGGTGNDTIITGGGNNTVYGLAGDDAITGGAGRDVVSGDSASDCLMPGQTCRDTVTGGGGNDLLVGGPGDDRLDGGADGDVLQGGTGNDTLAGGGGDDTLDGDDGSDILDGGTGADLMRGRYGDGTSPAGDVDTVSYATRTGPVTVSDTGAVRGDAVLDATVSGWQYKTDHWDGTVQRFVLGRGADIATLSLLRDRPVRIEGGPGADRMTVLQSVGQPSVLLGGGGDDVFVQPPAGTPSQNTPAPFYGDEISGGAGTDTVDYTSRVAGTVSVLRNGRADDGATGEFDNIRADVETVLGAATGSAPLPTVSIAGTTVVEASGATATLTVTLSSPSSRPTTVAWRTLDGTARSGSDYVAATGTVVIPAGRTSTTISVTVLADTVAEPAESFAVQLSGPINARLGTAKAKVTINP